MVTTSFREDPSLALATDQYELTMAYAFWKNGMADRDAVFHMSYRKNPFQGGYVVWAGLGVLIDLLEQFRFSQTDLDYLATLKDRTGATLFDEAFLRALEAMRFSCDIDAVPEGTIVFPNEPLLRVRGPIMQAQLLESFLLNTVNFQSLVATKAARICLAAHGDRVVDFGLRRAQGLNGALSASRACFIGGCVGTSNVLAGKLMNIPVLGTHAHSWVMAFDDERHAFEAFADAMPNNCVFLVDTYGTINGVRNAIAVAEKLRATGHEAIGVRLDSGDLAYFSKRARQMLDEAGFPDALIMASNELDEYVITSLKLQGAQINSWGVGTKLITAHEEPALSGVYKLTALKTPNGDWQYKLKLSEQKSKMSIPGILNVYRYYDSDGKMAADAITDSGEKADAVNMIIDPDDNIHRKKLSRIAKSESLLAPLFTQGQLTLEPPTLEQIRNRVQAGLAILDESHKRFEFPHIYPVGLSPQLNQIRDEMIYKERERLNDS